ncbi:MAG: DNA-3-methyladenine glycosylase [Patescibacteria group bacterium]|nr:DNA-3-methyladenine glycosylase [Patescibacteria group bacterium]
MPKLGRKFYQQPARKIAKKFLGKYLTRQTGQGKISGEICEVEVYSALSGDDAAHGNKRTKRTEILFGEGGHAYVYLIYGMYHMLGAVVNKKDIPEVVFVRAVIPRQGIELMKNNFGRPVNNYKYLTDKPGKLCKSFGITKAIYGTDLTGDTLYIEDKGIIIPARKITSAPRIGLNPALKSSKELLRFYYE